MFEVEARNLDRGLVDRSRVLGEQVRSPLYGVTDFEGEASLVQWFSTRADEF